MAFKLTIIRNVQGVEVPYVDCYVKITSSVIEASTPTKVQKVSVSIYDKGQLHAIDHDMVMFEPNLEDDSGNSLKQGYEYMKTLEKYSSAIDC